MTRFPLLGRAAFHRLGVLTAALFLCWAPAMAQSMQRPEAVRIELTDELGPVFADAQGRTLYTWRGDRNPGQSLCTDQRYDQARGAGSMVYTLPEPEKRPACTQTWPPFLASPDARPGGAWSIILRDGGARQWAFQGKPLYTYAFDKAPGEINGGDGVAGRLLTGRNPAWAPLDLPRGLLTASTPAGLVLMTEKGRVLYHRAGASLSKASSCGADCLAAWKPVAAPAVARPPEGWSVLDGAAGQRQWAYRGKALYTFTGDSRYGGLNGAEEPGWQPLVLHKPLPPPPDLTIQVTADGEVFADRNGMTVYGWGCGDEGPDRALCDVPGATQTYRLSICGSPATCIATWRPVLASKDARPVGRTWSIVEVDPTGAEQYAAPGQKGALRVWAYRGRPIYTYAGDKAPGDINGFAVASGFIWGYGVVRADGNLKGGF